MFASYQDTIALGLPTGLLLVAFLAVLHASFQVASSVLTLLSGHSFVHSKARHRLTSLNLAYIAGVFLATSLLIAGLTSAFVLWLPYDVIHSLWLILIGIAVIVGIVTMFFYYRRGKGTKLWIPRSFALYLESRAKSTKNVIEAATLGVVSVFAELPFTAVFIVATSLVLANSVALDDHLVIVGLYSLIVVFPLLVIASLLSAGHKLSHIQRWRESNKHFLQFVSGVGLLVVAIFIWVNYILQGSTL
ncbi:MAG: hypothetical protein ABIQ64_04710 [Candidatus Saccharimonadales bacterium]